MCIRDRVDVVDLQKAKSRIQVAVQMLQLRRGADPVGALHGAISGVEGPGRPGGTAAGGGGGEGFAERPLSLIHI